jgi:hypothetical protein
MKETSKEQQEQMLEVLNSVSKAAAKLGLKIAHVSYENPETRQFFQDNLVEDQKKDTEDALEKSSE